MQTVDKAIKLLNIFTVRQPEIGLSELARLADLDKAATRRFLVALQRHGFIEQNPQTKQYRLGIGFLHLAKIREASFPLDAIVQPALQRLTEATGETAHAGVLADGCLSTLGVCFPLRANRVHLDMAERLPLHATASGLALLAFAAPEVRQALPKVLPAFTASTNTDHQTLQHLLAQVARQGFGEVANSYEHEVTGIAVPFFNASGFAMGTLAVATPSSRMTVELGQQIRTALFTETQAVTQGVGGQLPATYARLLLLAQQVLNQRVA